MIRSLIQGLRCSEMTELFVCLYFGGNMLFGTVVQWYLCYLAAHVANTGSSMI